MGVLDKAKGAVGVSKGQHDAVDDLSNLCPTLSFQQRVIGFCICFVLGYLITFMSFQLFLDGELVPFAIIYSLGNILSLLSSMFLCGPKKQLKNMFDKHRKWTTIVYVTCLVLTLVLLPIPLDEQIKLAFILTFVVGQFCAGVWYNLSYIPLGRRTFCKCFKGAFGIEDGGSIV